MQINNIYTIDEVNTDDEYCYVDISGYGTVVIKTTFEGIVVDIFPLHIVDKPVASTWVNINDLIEDEDADK